MKERQSGAVSGKHGGFGFKLLAYFLLFGQFLAKVSSPQKASTALLAYIIGIMWEIIRHIASDAFYFWLVLSFITAPIIIFSIKPKHNKWIKMSGLLAAVFLTYAFTIFSVVAKQTAQWKAYDECQGGAFNTLNECEHLVNLADGAQLAGAIFFSWLLYAIPFVAFWEVLWRIRYKKALSGKQKKQWFSNSIIALAVLAFMLWVWIIAAAFYKKYNQISFNLNYQSDYVGNI